MRVAIVGSGALGLYYGALLQRGGEEVHFLLRRDYDAIVNNGLKVISVDGDFELPKVFGYRTTAEIGQVDLVIIGLKTFDNDRLYNLLQHLIGAETVILTLQNGLGNEEYLANKFPAERILGGIAFLCANRGEAGTVHHLGQGAIRIGPFRPEARERCQAIADRMIQCGLSCEPVDNLIKARWEKLVWNIPFNGLCALTGQDVTLLLSDPLVRAEIAALMNEVVAAANAQPLVPPIQTDAFISRMLSITDDMDHYRPSMMLDRLEGRPLELESIYVEPLKRAQAAGVDTPRTELLYALLAFGEKG